MGTSAAVLEADGDGPVAECHSVAGERREPRQSLRLDAVDVRLRAERGRRPQHECHLAVFPVAEAAGAHPGKLVAAHRTADLSLVKPHAAATAPSRRAPSATTLRAGRTSLRPPDRRRPRTSRCRSAPSPSLGRGRRWRLGRARRPRRRASRRPPRRTLRRRRCRLDKRSASGRIQYPGVMDALGVFSSATRAWFEQAFDEPTPAQTLGWPAIASCEHTLIQAPTGSGKTLAAFLYGIDRLTEEGPGKGLRLLYVSPLKALNYDIERNLRGPLAGLQSDLRVAVRTGDTPQRERAQMLREHPDVLITTPESLFLLLTSAAREMLRSVRTLILDEVHAVAGTKRGAHLALSCERLDRLVGTPVQRIGLSATQRPLAEIGRFVSGARPIRLVDAGSAKELDLQVVVPVEDMREPGAGADLEGLPGGSGEGRGTSIWPSIYPEVVRLVREHRSTIVFVNNRRLAERLALRLNELAEEEIARAHHGSIAREQRLEIEELLKRGAIPCLVATSSLELGIDMGAVDLVVQVESPKSVARGLQRVGRAGHELGAVSKGRIFPKFRADLLEATVIALRMREGAIEETVIPRNPLDVLAQQIVAVCAENEITVDELHELVRGAYPFADLSRTQLENVLDMLAGRYPSDEFAELRPRIIWDRTAGVIRGRPGAARLAVTNAGTIPDRGLYGVHLVDGGGRVGELDEEMVYEARAGQTFLLGASTWRIEEITRDRVLVSPAPGVPGAVPFWKGEGVGRPYELGTEIGKFSRELVRLSDETALERLRTEHTLDDRAARNLLTFLNEQAAATGVVPSDRTIVVERFRDEIGDWRVCILTPFGGRVHAP